MNKGYLPYPFCGGTDIRTQEICKDNDYDIWCDDCFVGFDSCHTLVEAVERWQKRTNPNQRGVMDNPEALARLFHDTYERMASICDYETRQDTKVFNPESPNGKLMIATCRKILEVVDCSKPDLFRIDESGDITKVKCANCGSPKEETQVNDYSI